jgi:hyperosmotically inducible periplasmic protein
MFLRKLATVSAVALLLGACSVTGGKQSAGEYVDDATISTRVRTAIVRDPNVSLTELDVKTMNGTVQLSGFTDDSSKKARAGEIAKSTTGVKEVKNDIVVKR